MSTHVRSSMLASGSQHLDILNRRQSDYVSFYDFSLTVKAAPHECVIRTGQP